MTDEGLIKIVIEGGALLATVIGGAVWVTQKLGDEQAERQKAVEVLRGERIKALGEAVSSRSVEIEKIVKQFEESQQFQDRHFGEIGQALRAYITNVEQKVHTNELYTRDNFVPRREFDEIKAALKELNATVRAMGNELKSEWRDDFESLKEDLKSRN